MYRDERDYTVYEVSASESIDLVIDKGKSVSEIAANDKTVTYRQNGPFADPRDGIYHPIGNVIKDGKLMQYSASKWGAFIIPTSGSPYVGYIADLKNNINGVKLAFQSTPILVTKGKQDIRSATEGTPSDVATTSAYRSAIGVKADGSVLLVTTKAKCKLTELADLMIKLGCIEALNLDGGGSVTRNLGQSPKGPNERKVSAAIVVRKSKEEEKPVVVPILIIDAGHGGIDPGSLFGTVREKDLTLMISAYQFARFQALGVPVAMTRTSDVTLTENQRTSLVENSGAKYCISNHINAGGGTGVEVIKSIYSDGVLAKKLFDAIVAAGQTGRKVYTRTLPNNSKRDYYFMHRETGPVETEIIEYGFIDNPEDLSDLQANWQKYAEAVVKGFCEYLGYKYIAPSTGTNIDAELNAALAVLVEKGIINTPDYWLKNAVKGSSVSGEYAGILIKNVSKKLQEVVTVPEKPTPTVPETPKPEQPKPETPTTPATPETPKPSTKLTEEELTKLATDTSVYIEVGGSIPGSGALLKDGYVLTAGHVPGTKNNRARLKNGSWYTLSFVATHPTVDIALCRIEDDHDKLPYLTLSTRGVKSGDKLVSVGHGKQKMWTKETGKVVREKTSDKEWEFDCSIPGESGDSGSAILNEYGEIVGVIVQHAWVPEKKDDGWEVRVDGSEAVNVAHPIVMDWLKQYL
ncbi:MAG TPA: phosphodiester glycosidase family protein [Candidatus Bathyarchaeia archaeon]|nr:phosphodiester glycosidase family protein [Candidatus Bathyarchaeia archaeon]